MAEGKNGVSPELTKKRWQFFPSLPLEDMPAILSIPKADGTVYLVDVDNLDRRPRKGLFNTLEGILSLFGGRYGFSQRIAENSKLVSKYLDNLICIRGLMNMNDAFTDTVLLRRDKDHMVADERCVEARKPCVHLITHREKPTLCIRPLPDALRMGANWWQLEFWVRL
ncbi:MAG: hypothetical protein EOP83_24025 [Verrucomicrobiaceae bacterium]|nr:MAG: hypothetical protein EOP83_24025 [Verrucomicrobiaceae bacterium]